MQRPFEPNVTPIVGVCNCSMFCCTLLYVDSSIAIILTGKRELVALLNVFGKKALLVVIMFLKVQNNKNIIGPPLTVSAK